MIVGKNMEVPGLGHRYMCTSTHKTKPIKVRKSAEVPRICSRCNLEITLRIRAEKCGVGSITKNDNKQTVVVIIPSCAGKRQVLNKTAGK